ncbi:MULTISPECIES: acyltransferase [unclassified Pseudomonas]|uniref:acyltransferase family protein n=1 Tax=unclassified Pseudomonas TaxID=196821 RepID=UPI00200F66E5|nr:MULTISPECIES: acyltransferase [unclassified Pseudomonas]
MILWGVLLIYCGGGMEEGRHNRDVDVLRGLAIVLVVSYHMAAVSYLPESIKFLLAIFNGSFGVDLFFVISGFLVSSSLARALNARMQGITSVLRVYFARRWFRTILPAIVWVVIWTLLSFVTPYFGIFSNNFHHAVSAVFQWAHIFLYVECVKGDGCGLFGYYWSLSLEEWFYLLLPLFFIVIKGRAVCIVISLLLVALFYLAFQGWPLWGVFRIEPMLCGILVYYFRVPLIQWISSRSYIKFFWCVVPVLLLVCMYATANFFGKAYVLIVLSCVFLLVISLPDKGCLMPQRAARLFESAGKFSFSIYLVHVPLIWFVGRLYEGYSGWIAIFFFNSLLFLLVWGLSAASFRWLELPSRNVGYWVSRKLESQKN